MSTQNERLFDGELVPRPEIVFGLVGALGTDLKLINSELSNSLLSVGYSSQTVRISELFKSIAMPDVENESDSSDGITSIDILMDRGDMLRRGIRHGGAAAALAITEISAARNESRPPNSGDGEKVDGDLAGPGERESHATIIRQLKHPEEVRLLRSVYGPRFVLIAASAPIAERRKAVRDRLKSDHPGKSEGWYADNVDRLLSRDQKDGRTRLGQRVRDTFELADAYISLTPGFDPGSKLKRLVGLLFGAPFETPTVGEQSMFHASGARLRSSDAGRQVGAVVVDDSGEVLVTGVNEVPKAGGGQYWVGDSPDHRDFREGFDVNERQKRDMIVEILDKLRIGGWLNAEKSDIDPAALAAAALNDGPLAKIRVADLLEFARVAHAEMAAISTAARRGTAIGGMTMYTTTYPCHECARLIIASGIKKVVYVDPYPKSQVPEMYRHEIVEGTSRSEGCVIFEPFEGVSPRLFGTVFAMPDRSRDEITGDYGTWSPNEVPPRLVAEAEAVAPMQTMEDGVNIAINKALAELGWLGGGDSIAGSADESLVGVAK